MGDLSKLNRFRVFIKDPNKKSVLKIIKEFTVLAFNKKEIPFYYFKFLYKKEISNYLDYIGLKEQILLTTHPKLNDPQYISLLDDKLFFAFFSEKVNLKTPTLISYNFKSTFYYNNTTYTIQSKIDLNNFFDTVFSEHAIDALFFRPPSEQGGKGCFKLTKENQTEMVDLKFETFMNDNYVHTEVVHQHKDISKINSSSVNTLRIVTLVTADNNTEIVSALMRFGVGDSVVDNASSGGFFVGIHINECAFKDYGYYLQEHSGAKVYEHPDSGIKFKDLNVPFFKEACELVIDAVKLIPVRLIGWDVAITTDGPVIIESNAHIHVPVSDMAYGGLLQNEHIQNVFKELKV
jgi:hypothetical protein